LKVNAVVYFRVLDPMKAVLAVVDYQFATNQLSQTTLRSILGQAELDELLAERDRINLRLQKVIDQQSDPWGVKVSLVEVKHVDLPETMRRAMARQAEAERERRAKVIHAEGEYQAATKLRDAARIIDEQPKAMLMRFLQTLTEVGAENNTTIVFPIPLDLFTPLLRPAAGDGRKRAEPSFVTWNQVAPAGCGLPSASHAALTSPATRMPQSSGLTTSAATARRRRPCRVTSCPSRSAVSRRRPRWSWSDRARRRRGRRRGCSRRPAPPPTAAPTPPP